MNNYSPGGFLQRYTVRSTYILHSTDIKGYIGGFLLFENISLLFRYFRGENTINHSYSICL